MKLTFGDLNAKAQAAQAHREAKLRENRIGIAMRVLERLAKLPAENAALWDFPDTIQWLGLSLL